MSFHTVVWHWRVPIYIGASLLLSTIMQLAIKGGF